MAITRRMTITTSTRFVLVLARRAGALGWLSWSRATSSGFDCSRFAKDGSEGSEGTEGNEGRDTLDT